MDVVDREYSALLDTIEQERQQTACLKERILRVTALGEDMMKPESRKIWNEILECVSKIKTSPSDQENRSTAGIVRVLNYLQTICQQHFPEESLFTMMYIVESKQERKHEICLEASPYAEKDKLRLLEKKLKTFVDLEDNIKQQLEKSEDLCKQYQREAQECKGKEKTCMIILLEKNVECERLKETVENLKKRNEILKDKLKEQEDETKSLTIQLQSAKKTYEEIKYKKLETEKATNESGKNFEITNKILEEKVKRLESELLQYHNSVLLTEEQKEHIRTLQKENEDLRISSDKKIAEMTVVLQNLEKKHDNLDVENKRLQNVNVKYEVLKENLNLSNKTKLKDDIELEKLRNETKQKQGQLSHLETELTNARTQIEHLTAEKDKIKVQYHEVAEALTSSKKSLTMTEQNLQANKTHFKEVSDQLTKLTHEQKFLVKENEKIRLDMQKRLCEQEKIRDKNLEEVQEEMSKHVELLNVINNALEEEKKIQQEIIRCMNRNHSDNTATLAQLQSLLEKKDAEVTDQKKQIDVLKRQCKQEIDAKQESELIASDREKHIKQLEIQISHSKEKADVDRKHLKEEKEKNDKTIEIIQSYNEDLRAARESYKVSLREIEEKATEDRNKIAYLQSRLDEEIKLKTNLENQNHELKLENEQRNITYSEEKLKLTNTNALLNTEVAGLQKEITRLRNENKTLTATIQQKESEKEQQKQQYKREIELKKNQIELEAKSRNNADVLASNLQEKIANLRLEMNRMTEQANQLKKEKKEYEKNSTSEKEQLYSKLACLEAKVSSLEKHVDELQRELGKEKESNEKVNTENNKLKHNLNEMAKTLQQTNSEKTQFEKQRLEAEKEAEHLMLQSQRLQAALEESVNKSQSYQKELMQQKDKQAELMRKYEETSRTLKKITAKRRIQVQLYSSNRGDMLLSVETELTKTLREKLETDYLQLEFIQCASQTEIKPDIPMLLLCTTASRLGVDVSNVLQGITPTKKMALLVFHHKDVHALPSQASDRVLSISSLSYLGAIFDMAFLTGKGIYSCCMNNNGLVSIVNFIKHEGTEVPVYHI